jgi:hypothetical protein
MKNERTFKLASAILSTALLIGPSAAQAQRGAHVAGRIASSSGGSRRAGGVRSAISTGGGANAHADRISPGFDFTGTPVFFPNGNVGNIRDTGIEAAIDPATQFRLAFRDRFRNRGFFPEGGYLLWDGGQEYVPPDESANSGQPGQQPPVVIVQQAPAAQPEDAAADEAPEAAPADGPLVPGDNELTLVLRNGDKIRAVAFTRRDDSIIYITPDGLRRTLALSDLDSDETLRVNQEQGTPLQSSSL